MKKQLLSFLAVTTLLISSSFIFFNTHPTRIDLESAKRIENSNPEIKDKIVKDVETPEPIKESVTPPTVVVEKKPTSTPVTNKTQTTTKIPIAQKPVVTKSAKPTVTNTTVPTSEQQPTTDSVFKQQVLTLINAERAKNNLKILVLDTKLSSVAQVKSQDMHDNNYFSHTSPTYGSPFDMMKKFGITYSWAAENIAQGQRTPQEVVNAWMFSPGHKANILSASATTLGVGYVADGHYWTQMFIGK